MIRHQVTIKVTGNQVVKTIALPAEVPQNRHRNLTPKSHQVVSMGVTLPVVTMGVITMVMEVTMGVTLQVVTTHQVTIAVTKVLPTKMATKEDSVMLTTKLRWVQKTKFLK